MAGYLSPATFQTPNHWYAEGGLGGFLAGMNQEIGNQVVGREFAQDDVALARQKAALKEDEGTVDSKIALAAAKADEARYLQDEITSGRRAQDDALARGIKEAQRDALIMKNDDEKRTQAANLWVDMANELKAMGGTLNPMDANHRAWYDSWRQKMSKFAPNMPAMLDTAGQQNVLMQGQKASQFLAMKERAALNPRDQQIKEAAAVANDARETARAESVARIGATSRENVADTAAAAKLEAEKEKQRARDAAKKMEQLATRSVENAKREGKITEDAMGSAEWLAEQRLIDRMKVDPEFKLAMLEGGEVSETKFMTMRAKVAEQILPGYAAAKTGQQPKTVTQQPAAAPASASPAPTKAAPTKGTVEQGYEFLGGDPSNPKSWKKVK